MTILCQNYAENQDIMPELVPDLNNARLMPDHSKHCQIWHRKCQYGNIPERPPTSWGRGVNDKQNS
uniref:Uncharacterized protein n=1 Tax=Romanomermis culicivorax TaxID=13658 RepID=A0A915LB49_ROMCU